MNLYIDSANFEKIKELYDWLPVFGVTVNPTILAKDQITIADFISQIKELDPKCTHIQVTHTETEEIIDDVKYLWSLGLVNISAKIPVTKNGLKAIKKIKGENKAGLITATAIYNANQALIAAEAGADFLAPYVSRIDRLEYSGLDTVLDIKTLLNKYNLDSKIIAASIKNAYQLKEILKIGVDSVTLAPNLIEESFQSDLTDQAEKDFLNDWSNVFESFKLTSQIIRRE
ncbi:MAG: transaldolase family protein [bacterium]